MAFFCAWDQAVPLLVGKYEGGVIGSGHRALVELLKNLWQRLKGHRPAEQIALDKVAAELVEKFELLDGFNPLGDYLQVQGMGHEDNGLNDLHVLAGGRDVLNKSAINFQGVKRQTL